MFLLTIYVAISVALVNSGSAPAKKGSGAPGKQGDNCVCPYIYDPQCGVDGVTYPNTCLIECAGVDIASPGDCPIFDGFLAFPPGGVCECDSNVALVCGVDGNTYPNICVLQCFGVGYAHDGPC